MVFFFVDNMLELFQSENEQTRESVLEIHEVLPEFSTSVGAAQY